MFSHRSKTKCTERKQAQIERTNEQTNEKINYTQITNELSE